MKLKDISYFAFVLSLAGISIVLVAYFARPPVDDAYITFRYAWNVFQGHSLVYNPGEWLLGVTTPLWAYIFAGLFRLGCPVESTAQAMNLIFAAAFALLFSTFYLRDVFGRFQAAFLIPLLLLFYYVHGTISSGMESILYALCLLRALWALEKDRFVLAGLSSGLAALLRPDGLLLLFIIGGFAACKSIKKSVLFATVFLIVVLPWFCYAYTNYGTFIPHSIAAKQIIHPSSALQNLLILTSIFSYHPADFLLFIFMISGLIYLARQPRFWPVLAWIVLYFLGLVFSGIKPIFYWYFGPLWMFLLSYGSLGIFTWLRDNPKKLGPAHNLLQQGLFPILVVVVSITSLVREREPDPGVTRDNVYRQIAQDFAQKVKDDDLLYLGETGILGYHFRRNKVLDSSGINSRAVYEVRKAAFDQLGERAQEPLAMDRHSNWSIDIVKRYQPDWIISLRIRSQMIIMEEQQWFQDQYERVAIYNPQEQHGVGVYRLRSRE